MGKIWTPVLKRSVHRILNQKGINSGKRLKVGEDSVVFDEYGSLAAVAVREGNETENARYAIHNAVNNIYAKYGIPRSILISLHLGRHEDEGGLKRWVRKARETADGIPVEIIGGHTSSSGHVDTTLISITALGKPRSDISITASGKPRSDMPVTALEQSRSDMSLSKGHIGSHVIITGYAGLEGTDMLIRRHGRELRGRYTDGYLHGIDVFFVGSCLKNEVDILWESYDAKVDSLPPVLHDVSEGGVLGALWELAEYLSCGLEIDMKSIPLKQLTVEVCEFLDIDPYVLRTCGSLLVVTDEADAVLEYFHGNDIPARDIGVITAGKKRVLINNGRIRHMEPFRGDSLSEGWPHKDV